MIVFISFFHGRLVFLSLTVDLFVGEMCALYKDNYALFLRKTRTAGLSAAKSESYQQIRHLIHEYKSGLLDAQSFSAGRR